MNHETIDSKAVNKLFMMTLAFAGVTFAISAWAWFRLPDGVQVPVHWNIDGNPDRYASKTEGLFTMPVVMLVVATVFRLIPAIEPRRRNLLRSFTAYRVTTLATMGLLFAIHSAAVASLLGLITMRLNLIVGVAIAILMMLLGNYLGKVRSNFMFGIRTPWTLSSNYTWDKTHRLGGKLLFLSGLVGLVLIAAAPAFGMRIMIGLVIASSLFVVGYSWWVWRKAPDRSAD